MKIILGFDPNTDKETLLLLNKEFLQELFKDHGSINNSYCRAVEPLFHNIRVFSPKAILLKILQDFRQSTAVTFYFRSKYLNNNYIKTLRPFDDLIAKLQNHNKPLLQFDLKEMDAFLSQLDENQLNQKYAKKLIIFFLHFDRFFSHHSASEYFKVGKIAKNLLENVCKTTMTKIIARETINREEYCYCPAVAFDTYLEICKIIVLDEKAVKEILMSNINWLLDFRYYKKLKIFCGVTDQELLSRILDFLWKQAKNGPNFATNDTYFILSHFSLKGQYLSGVTDVILRLLSQRNVCQRAAISLGNFHYIIDSECRDIILEALLNSIKRNIGCSAEACIAIGRFTLSEVEKLKAKIFLMNLNIEDLPLSILDVLIQIDSEKYHECLEIIIIKILNNSEFKKDWIAIHILGHISQSENNKLKDQVINYLTNIIKTDQLDEHDENFVNAFYETIMKFKYSPKKSLEIIEIIVNKTNSWNPQSYQLQLFIHLMKSLNFIDLIFLKLKMMHCLHKIDALDNFNLYLYPLDSRGLFYFYAYLSIENYMDSRRLEHNIKRLGMLTSSMHRQKEDPHKSIVQFLLFKQLLSYKYANKNHDQRPGQSKRVVVSSKVNDNDNLAAKEVEELTKITYPFKK